MSVEARLEVIAKSVPGILIVLGFLLVLIGYQVSPINESEVNTGGIMVFSGAALYVIELLIKKYG
jgi:hypothetical protein